MKSYYQFIEKKLANLKKINLYRKLKLLKVQKNHNIIIDGKKAIDFSSNDYLGLSQHPKVIEATKQAVGQYGTGATASRLISGNREYHIELEEALAQFKSKEKALLFGSGYLANLALLSTLPSPHDLILSDSLNHASIIDGTRLSRAKVINYPHLDMNWLNNYLSNNRDNYQQLFIVSDAVFSMDGDIAPLTKIYHLCDKFNAIPIFDEAHSTGVLGDMGKGIESHFNTHYNNAIIMGTLGKALGSYGAFVCGKSELIDFLVNRARPFIFSTALPPAPVASALKSLELIQSEPEIVSNLRTNLDSFKASLSKMKINITGETPIIPIIIGDEELCMKVSQELLLDGVFIQGVRPPTVAKGTARLRVTLSSTHSLEDLNQLTLILSGILRKYGIVK